METNNLFLTNIDEIQQETATMLAATSLINTGKFEYYLFNSIEHYSIQAFRVFRKIFKSPKNFLNWKVRSRRG